MVIKSKKDNKLNMYLHETKDYSNSIDKETKQNDVKNNKETVSASKNYFTLLNDKYFAMTVQE